MSAFELGTNSSNGASEASIRDKINALQAQREALELEAEAIGSELTSKGPNGEPPAGIKDALIDREGYPRADIDLYRTRAYPFFLAFCLGNLLVCLFAFKLFVCCCHHPIPRHTTPHHTTPLTVIHPPIHFM